MDTIRTANNRAFIEQVINRVASQPVSLFLPSYIQAWCEEHGMSQSVRHAVAVKCNATGTWGIVISSEFSTSAIESIVAGMEFRGFNQARQLTKNHQLFLAHLVLHELAHLEHDWNQDMESACDEWAFQKLDIAL